MKSRLLAVAGAAVMMVALAGASAGAGGGSGRPSLVDSAPCEGIPGFTCAWLTVPLDRSGRVGATLRLQVGLETDAKAPKGTLMVLSGGPGQPGVSLIPRISQRLSFLMADYRLIMIDQRGTGAGAIDCPRLQEEAGSSDIVPASAAAIAECAQKLGATRNFYTSSDTVADLDDLRKALGLKQWTLDGVSYGAFVAAQYGLTHPQRVEKLVLDSVVPKDGVPTLYADSLHHVAWMMREACREQSCGFDPAADLEKLLAVQDLGVDFFDFVVTASIVDPKLTGTTFWPVLDFLHLAANGQPGPLKEAITELHSGAPPPADYSSGLHIATLCADLPDAPWGDSSAPLAGRDAALAKAVDRLDASYVWPFPRKTAGEHAVAAACKQWPPTRPDPEPSHLKLTMPVLILNGDRDLSTPVKWARDLALAAPRARLVVIEGMGHSTQGRHPVADDAVRSFLLG